MQELCTGESLGASPPPFLSVPQLDKGVTSLHSQLLYQGCHPMRLALSAVYVNVAYYHSD